MNKCPKKNVECAYFAGEGEYLRTGPCCRLKALESGKPFTFGEKGWRCPRKDILTPEVT